ncbi:MAG: hypothetical protein ATN35_02105 [Epulopiscium sp. Nele67-Bin004]|nr:MAG: hypothetical protein ATN35_02105 [Epulopiscium sp. Nele67-Bin004]
MLLELLVAAFAGWNYDKIINYCLLRRNKKKLQREFNSVFYALGILDKDKGEKVYFRHTLGNQNYMEFCFGLDETVTVSRFQFRLEDIRSKLALDNLEIEAYERAMYFTVRNQRREPLIFKSHDVPESHIPLGYNDFNRLICWNLSIDAHCLVGGSTGGGKSTLIRSIIFHLIINTSSDLILVDLKAGLEFSPLRNLKNVISYGDCIYDAEQAIYAVTDECNRRLKLLKKDECKDIQAYNSGKRVKLNRLFLIIDEFADLATLKRKKDEPNPIADLIELSRKCRAVGIHLILSTQRPSAKILSGELKGNFTALIGLRTNDMTNSRVIIDKNGLEALSVGESISVLAGKTEEFRTQLLEGKQLSELIKLYAKDASSQGSYDSDEIIDVEFTVAEEIFVPLLSSKESKGLSAEEVEEIEKLFY